MKVSDLYNELPKYFSEAKEAAGKYLGRAYKNIQIGLTSCMNHPTFKGRGVLIATCLTVAAVAVLIFARSRSRNKQLSHNNNGSGGLNNTNNIGSNNIGSNNNSDPISVEGIKGDNLEQTNNDGKQEGKTDQPTYPLLINEEHFPQKLPNSAPIQPKIEQNVKRGRKPKCKIDKQPGFFDTIATAKWTKESLQSTKSKREDWEWKIIRYENYIIAFSNSINNYFISSLGCDVAFVLGSSTQEQKNLFPKADTKFIEAITPLLTLSHCEPRDEETRFNSYDNYRIGLYHKSMVDALRKAATWANQNVDKPESKHIFALCHAFYTLDFNAGVDESVRTIVQQGEVAQLTIQNKNKKGGEFDNEVKFKNSCLSEEEENQQQYKILQKCIYVHNCIGAFLGFDLGEMVKSVNAFLGGKFYAFDPHKESNFPQALFRKIITTTKKKVNAIDIAMPTPTSNSSEKVEIVPEFIGYLNHLKLNKMKHLYINNQNMLAPGKLEEDERPRCKALRELADNETWKDTLTLITLSQDSPFYKQEEKKYTHFDNFKTDLLIEMFKLDSSASGNDIPKDLQKNYGLYKWSEELAQKIYEQLYLEEEKKNFVKDAQLRREFIEIFYQFLIEKITVEELPDYYNISCKDRIDRGAKTDFENGLLHASKNNKLEDENVIHSAPSFMHGRSAIVRKRAMKEHRADIAMKAGKRIIDYSKGIVSVYTDMLPKVEVTIEPLEKIKN